jgi:dUTP pyrophosphatase
MSSSRILYLAEPIDQSDFGAWKESVQSFAQLATKRGWLVFRPASAWKLDPAVAGVGSEIETINRLVMGSAGAIVAHLPAGVPSVGVPREIEWGVSSGVPTVVATDKPGWSLHDVHTVELGDVPGFGMWLKAVEEVDPQGTDPIAFLVEDGGTLPTRANNGDAGFDLYTSEDTLVPAGEFVDVPCGVRVAFPPGMWGRIAGRSSTLRKRGLLVAEGIIDTGYRGPLYAGVRNLEDEDKWVRKGERIAQLIPHDNVATNHHAVEIDRGLFARIPGDGRGEAGFGSSGN